MILRGICRPVTTRDAGGAVPPRKFLPSLEKCVGHSLKLLDIVEKFWAGLGKLCSSWCPKLVVGLGIWRDI